VVAHLLLLFFWGAPLFWEANVFGGNWNEMKLKCNCNVKRFQKKNIPKCFLFFWENFISFFII